MRHADCAPSAAWSGGACTADPSERARPRTRARLNRTIDFAGRAQTLTVIDEFQHAIVTYAVFGIHHGPPNHRGSCPSDASVGFRCRAGSPYQGEHAVE